MVRKSSRGTALITALAVLTVVFVTGSGILSLSMQAARRGRMDALRARALALAEAGGEKAIYYLRTTAPNGTRDGSWRTNGYTETLPGQGSYTMAVQNGTGDNAGRIVITSTGTATDGGLSIRRAVRIVLKLEREDVSVWNNAIFGGVGQAGKSINGNVVIRGSVHLLGDGERFTDVDLDGRWDSGESYTDSNGNGRYDVGEPYTDADGDGHWDAREPFDDVNGNGTRDPALTVTDLSSELNGDANIGNNYNGMPSNLRALVPPPPTAPFRGETVETLNAKLRAKHGRVNISGSASVGNPDVYGGSPPVKETVDGTYVTDGFGGNKGATQVYSDNGANAKYNLGDLVTFPALTDPVVVGGVSYPSYMDYLKSSALVVTGPLTLKVGTPYGPISDSRGNSLSVDASGTITIRGIVYVNGDVSLDRGTSKTFRYSGRGTLVSSGSIFVHTDLYPTGPTFPINHAMGLIARRRIELATGGGDSQLTMAGAFYAQEMVKSYKQNEIAGSFVCSYYEMQNVPHMYQVPALAQNLPPGMPGDRRIWVKTLQLVSWREVRPG